MPQIIEIPGVGPVEFPDGMSDEAIASAIQQNTGPVNVETELAASFAKPQVTDTPSAAGAFFREAGRSIAPGLAGFGAGAATAGAAGSFLGPVGTAVAGVGGGLLGAMGVRFGQDALADEIAPESFMGTQSAQADFGAHPVASLVGGAVGGGGRPAPLRALNVGRTLATAEGRALLAAGARAEAPAAARLALADTADVAMGAGIGAGMSLATGDGMTAENALLGTIFNRSIYGGRSMMPQTGEPAPLRGPVTRMQSEPAVARGLPAPRVRPDGAPVELASGPVIEVGGEVLPPIVPEIAPIAPEQAPPVIEPITPQEAAVIAAEPAPIPAIEVAPEPVPTPEEVAAADAVFSQRAAQLAADEAALRSVVITPPEAVIPPLNETAPRPVDEGVPIPVPAEVSGLPLSREGTGLVADAPPPVVEPLVTPEVPPVEAVAPPVIEPAPAVEVPVSEPITTPAVEAPAAPLTAKRGKTFASDGLYSVETAGGTRRMFRDPESGWWYHEEAPGTKQVHHSERVIGFNKKEALASMEVKFGRPAPEEAAPLAGRSLAMNQGHLKNSRAQLARMEAAGKTPEQTAKVRARVASLTEAVKAGEPFVKDRAREVIRSGETPILDKIKELGGFTPPHKNLNIIRRNLKNGAKLSEAHRQLYDQGRVYDDAPSPTHYDGSPAGSLAKKLLTGLYNSDGNGRSPDQLAKQMGMSTGEFWAALKTELDSVYRNNGTMADAADATTTKLASAREDFDDAVAKTPNRDRGEAGELSKGDTFEIDGEPMRVVSKEGNSVTLRSERFGDQVVDVEDMIPMDNLKAAAKPAPESAMDRKAADSRQLFDDDGGFALKQESTGDGDAITKAKADKEAAAAKADDEQGKMFEDDEEIEMFGRAPADTKSILDSLRAHRDRVGESMKGDRGKSFAVIPGLDPVTAKRVYTLALDTVIKAIELGDNIRVAIQKGMAALASHRLDKKQAAAVEARLAADIADQLRFAHQRDGQMRVETAKLAQEFAAAGNQNPSKGDFIRELSATFPDQAAFIRKNIDGLFDGMMFDRASAADAAAAGKSGEWSEWADDWRDRVQGVLRAGKESIAEKRLANTARALHDTIFTGIGNKVHNLANGKHTGRQSKALKAFAVDTFGIKAGEDGIQRVSADVAAESDSNRMLNPLDGMAGDLDTYFKTAGIPRADRSAFKSRITDHMVNPARDGELAKQPELKKAVDFFLARRKERLAYMRENLVDVGDAGERSASRVMDPLKVMANRGEFIDQATKTYRAKWARDVAKLQTEALALKARGKDGDAERYEKIMEKIDEINAMDPKDAAAQYFYGIESGERGVSSDGNDIFGSPGGHRADSHKSREFGSEADTHLGKFMFRDAFDLDAFETTAAVRSVTRARMLATKNAAGDIDPAGKWKVLRKQLEDEGNGDMVPNVATLIKSYLNLGGASNEAAQSFLEVTHAFTQLAYLSRAGVSNLGEPVLIGLRTGSVGNMVKAYKLTGQNIGRRLRGLPPSEAQIIANALGVAKGGMNSLMGAARMQDAFGGRGKLGKLVSAFHVKTLLNDTTMAMHEAATEIGRGFIHAELQMAKADGSLSRLSRKNLTELGIGKDDIDRMLAFTNRIEKAGDKKAIILENSADAKTYRDALTLFNRSGAVLDPTRGSRAQGANNPVGSLFYSLQSFLYEFHQKITARHFARAKSAITGKMDVEGVSETLSAEERTKIGTEIMAGIASIYAAQFGVQMVREKLFSDPVRLEKDKRRTGSEILKQRLNATASRTGIFGPYDILFNMVTQARFQRDAATTLLGPAVGGYSELFKAIVDYSGDRNTDGTNTAERKLARTAYNLTVAPLAGAFAATMPGRLIPGALIQGAYHPGIRETAVKAAAGPAVIPKGPLRRNE